MKNIILQYGNASRQLVNLDKSAIIFISNTSFVDRHVVAFIFKPHILADI